MTVQVVILAAKMMFTVVWLLLVKLAFGMHYCNENFGKMENQLNLFALCLQNHALPQMTTPPALITRVVSTNPVRLLKFEIIPLKRKISSVVVCFATREWLRQTFGFNEI